MSKRLKCAIGATDFAIPDRFQACKRKELDMTANTVLECNVKRVRGSRLFTAVGHLRQDISASTIVAWK